MPSPGPTDRYTSPAPKDAAEAAERLGVASVPPPIETVVRELQRADHQAVLVGGAVRDVILGLPASDWDVATSALPTDVQALFRKTIPTGIEHGTVTVLVRSDDGNTPVEVTTFRGEGTYVDGRRPSAVTFDADLRKDLARRDFTVNAFAWDPVSKTLSDPFDGVTDLRAGLVRAVGDAAERFAEDGLRTMRAVRFCATHRLELEAATEAAITPALAVLDQVSRERVHVELTKLLASARPSDGLRPMLRTQMWSHVLPAIDDDAEASIEHVDALRADSTLRLARLLLPLARRGEPGEVVRGIDALKPSRAERSRVLALTSASALRLGDADDPALIRRAVAGFGAEHLADVLAILAIEPAPVERACRGAAFSVGDLAVKGRDLIATGIVTAGPQVGELLRRLLDAVLDDPTLNNRDKLLELSRRAG